VRPFSLFQEQDMKVAITGGAGFIGANLVRALRAAEPDWQLTVIDNLSTGCRSNLEGIDDVILYEASILDDIALDATFEVADAVVHLAARPSVQRSIVDPLVTHDVNATGTLRVLEAARRADVQHIVVASSSSVYGAARPLPSHEELPVAPLSPYGASKLAAESYALAYGHGNRVPVLVLRLFSVFGPLQSAGHAYAAAIPAFMAAAMKGRPIPIFGDGLQTRDFTYVDSVCEVLIDALRRNVADDRPVNLAFGTRRTLLDVVDTLSEVLGIPLDRMHASARPGEVRDSQADHTRLRALFPSVEPVEFRAGLEATVKWFRAQQQQQDRAVAAPALVRR
jgi:UDP-glucose 4-epimerase